MNDFDILPSYNSIEEIDRDLGFFPGDPDQATTLTAKQVETYNRDGYLSGIDVFDSNEATQLRQYFDQLLADVMAAGGDSYSISTAHLSYGRVYDLLTHPTIVSHLKDLLGEHVVGWGSHFFCKMPRDGKAVAWHQDAGYWPLTPSRTATVWLAIDDADVENACLRFIPGSHRHGQLEWRESEESENNVLNQTVENALDYGAPVDNVLRAGQMSIHNDLLLHGSNANDSDRRRCGLTLRYCAAEVHAYMDWNQKGVVVAGEADPRLWPGAERPA